MSGFRYRPFRTQPRRLAKSLVGRGGSADAWTPEALSSLVAWFDPSYGVYSDAGTTPAVVDDPVYRWVSRNNASLYLEQATLSQRPILKQAAGGDKYLLSDGTDDAMVPSIQIAPTSATMLIQLYKTGGSDDATGWGCFGTGGNTHCNFADGSIYDSFGTTSRASFTGLAWQNNWVRYACTSQGGSIIFRANGSQIYSRGTNTVGWRSRTSQALFAGTPPAAGAWNGRTGHFVVSEALSANDLASLETWALAEIPA